MSIIHDTMNATTCNGMREWTDERVGQAMREYAKAVAEDTLKRAAERAEMVFHCGHTKVNTTRRHYQIGADNLQVDKQSILSTPINTDL